MTALTAARSKHRKNGPSHVVNEFPDWYGRTWFYTRCGRYLSLTETIPWEDTAPEDRCRRCVNRLDREEADRG